MFHEQVRVARCGLRVVPLALAHQDGRLELEPVPPAEALAPVRRDEPPMPVPQVAPQPPEWIQDGRLEQLEACWEALHDPLPLVVASPRLAGLALVVQAVPPVPVGPAASPMPADPVLWRAGPQRFHPAVRGVQRSVVRLEQRPAVRQRRESSARVLRLDVEQRGYTVDSVVSHVVAGRPA